MRCSSALRTTSSTVAAVGSLLLSSCATSDPVTAVDTPDRLEFRSVPSVAVAGQVIDPAIQVTVLRADGSVATSAAVPVALSARLAVGSDTVRGDTIVVTSAGVATFQALRVNRASDDTRFVATSPGLVGARSAAVRVLAGPPATLAFLTQPDSAVAGVNLPIVRVEARDAGGNRSTVASGVVAVSVVTGPDGATIVGTAVADLVQGLAVFPDLMLPRAGTGYALQATLVGVDGVTRAITRTFRTRPGAAAVLVFDQQPSAGIVGQPFIPAVTVQVHDGFGNVVPTASPTVSMQVAVAAAGFTLQGTTAVAAAAGVATFANLRPDRTSSVVRLRADAPGLASAISAAFAVGAVVP